MRKHESISRAQAFFHFRPQRFLPCIRNQVADDGSSLRSFFDTEERLPRFPAVLFGLGVVTRAYDDIESVILKIQRLGRSPDAITENRNGFVL